MHAAIHSVALIAKSSTSSGSPLATFLPLILIGAVFYFLLIRPQQRRARAQRALLQSIDVGDEVITVGGIFAKVRAVDDDSVTLEVAPGTELRFLRSAIARKVNLDEGEEESEGEEAGESS